MVSGALWVVIRPLVSAVTQLVGFVVGL
jgi:hypothetical protein